VDTFLAFLDVLENLRGGFLRQVSRLVSSHIHDILWRPDVAQRYIFERMDGETLKKEQLDSPGLIRFCELEDR